jgi:hypothetical protein
MKPLTDNLNLSLLELLSVLLPGAMGLAILNQIDYIKNAAENVMPSSGDWKDNVGYIAAAYFVGYTIYVTSVSIDDLFDKLKNNAVKNKVEKGCTFSHEGVKWWAKFLFPHIDDTYTLLNKVLPIKKKHLQDCEPKPINAFQYCYRRLMMEGQPIMYAEVERYEATSKFFRSMIIIWILSIFTFWQTAFVWVAAFLLLISLRVYLNRRQKALHVAFKNILVLEGVKNT